jgi:peptide/nickel transport system permease protein
MAAAGGQNEEHVAPRWNELAGHLSFVFVRLLRAVPVLIGIAALNFLLIQLVPGDAADVLAGESGAASPEFMADVRARFGLDKPLHVRFGLYLWNLLHFDLGHSFRFGLPVTKLLLVHLGPTLLLMTTAILFAFSSGVFFGILAARLVNRWPDALISVVALVVYATPVFWFGLMLIVFLSVRLGLLPSGGYETIGPNYVGFAHAVDVARHMVMPVTVLSLFLMALYVRLMRASMLEVASLDFVTTARAKGLSENEIAYRHVLRNSILPMVTMLGLQIGAMLGGSVLVETVFAWPGLGRLAYTAVFQRDINLLLGILLVSSCMVILTNILTDLAYRLIDPRIGAAG